MNETRLTRDTSHVKWLWLLLAVASSVSCEENDDPEATEAREPSPNASITPAPLVSAGALVAKTTKGTTPAATVKVSAKRVGTAELPDPPVPLSVQQVPSADVTTSRPQAQISLAGRLVWPAYPSVLRAAAPPQRTGEAVPSTWRSFEVAARSGGRLQIRFSGPAFTFEDGTLIASRIENYGHLLLWPGEQRYRVLPPGSGRTLFTEGRPDVSPMVLLEPEPHPGPSAFDHPTRVWTFETNRGKLQLQQAEIEETELAGPLLCRFLLELISVSPASSACDVGSLPTRAEFEIGGGKLIWETTDLEVKSDPQMSSLAVPPGEARFQEYGLPSPADIMPASERAALRKNGRTGSLTVHNPAPVTVWLLLDGLPVARVEPAASAVVEGLSQGTYQARLVDFFGAEVQAQPNLALGDAAAFGNPKQEPADTNEL